MKCVPFSSRSITSYYHYHYYHHHRGLTNKGFLSQCVINTVEKQVNLARSDLHHVAWKSLLNHQDHVTFLQSHRHVHTSPRLWQEDSSKVESAVKALKEDEKTGIEKVVKEKPKRSLMKRVKDELIHYYHGFRLLFIDIMIARRLAWKSVAGGDLTRREYRQLTRTTADIFRLVPFSIFVIVPFMEFLLPVFLKFFPGMLPSTFQTAKDRDTKIKQELKVKLDMTKFLQTTLDELAITSKGTEHHSHTAKQFADFFSQIRQSGEMVTNEDILKFSKLFEDEITLDSLDRPQLIALCRLLELKPMGPTNLLRFQLRMRLRSLKSDDKMIQKEGITSLTVPELQQACRSRGMRALGIAEDRLRLQLDQWLELSLNEKIPPSLILLSRVLYLPDNLPATDQLKATIQSLPIEVGTEAKYKIGEAEGKIDNRTRVEMIKQEEAAIKKELEEKNKDKKEAEDKKKQSELLADTVVIKDTAEDMSINLMTSTSSKPTPSVAASSTSSSSSPQPGVTVKQAIEPLTKEDLESLENALEQIEMDKQSLTLEKEELEDIKEEMADYKEDVAEFVAIRQITGKKELKESTAAKLLRKKVDKMISNMDNVLVSLEKKAEQIQQRIETMHHDGHDGDIKSDQDTLININELLNALKKANVQDEEKTRALIDLLDSMDADNDGKVEKDHVAKIIDMLGREDVNVSSDQIKDIAKQMIREEEEKEKEQEEKQKEKTSDPRHK